MACDLYRVSFYSQLTGREPPGRFLVTDAELCEAIRDSFGSVGEAEYQEICDDALAFYRRFVARRAQRSRNS